MLVFFFFKKKTAYEMRMSDWSSDVCSSDLERRAQGRDGAVAGQDREAREIGAAADDEHDDDDTRLVFRRRRAAACARGRRGRRRSPPRPPKECRSRRPRLFAYRAGARADRRRDSGEHGAQLVIPVFPSTPEHRLTRINVYGPGPLLSP